MMSMYCCASSPKVSTSRAARFSATGSPPYDTLFCAARASSRASTSLTAGYRPSFGRFCRPFLSR